MKASWVSSSARARSPTMWWTVRATRGNSCRKNASKSASNPSRPMTPPPDLTQSRGGPDLHSPARPVSFPWPAAHQTRGTTARGGRVALVAGRREEQACRWAGAGGPPWRHLRSDRSVVDNKIERQTVRRVLAFARPHRRLIAGFLGVTVVDAALVVVPPLLLKAIIDDGVSSGDTSLVVWLAVLVAVVAVVDAGFGLITGWLSSRIGEGLIYDLRTQVFAHVQRQSLAFFTRTQTGALVSRLNNDVIGAQRAFTSTLQGTVSNIIAAIVVGVTMLFLSWPVTVLCLALFPILLLASRLVGARLADLSRAQMDGNADLGNAMTERFNVGGAMLLKLFGRREAEDVAYAQKAAVVRDLGIRISLLTRIFFAAMTLVPSLATAMVYGIGGWLAIRGDLSVGTIVALGVLLTRLLGPLQGLSNVRIDVMTALVSFDRVFEVLDLPSLIQEKPDASRCPPPRRGSSSTTSRSPTRAPTRSRWPRSRPWRAPSPATPGRCSTTSRSRPSPARWSRWSARPVPGKTTVTHLVARLYDVESGAVRVGGHDVRDVTLQSLEDVVGYVTQDAHMFHDTIRANLLYARPGAVEADVWAALEAAQIAAPRALAARRPRHRRGGPGLPPQRRRAAAPRDRPAAAQGALDRRPRRGDRPPRQRVRGRGPAGARRGARGTYVARDRAPALHRPQRRPDPRARRRPRGPAGHPRRAARRRRALRHPPRDPVPRRQDRARPPSRAEARPRAARATSRLAHGPAADRPRLHRHRGSPRAGPGQRRRAGRRGGPGGASRVARRSRSTRRSPTLDDVRRSRGRGRRGGRQRRPRHAGPPAGRRRRTRGAASTAR